MVKELKAGVAGAGVFGGYHANKYKEVDGAELVAIFDVDEERAKLGAADRGVEGFADFDAFLEQIDILTVATPASTHGDLAEAALAADKHVLVEKPIALDLGVADRMIATAADKDLIIQVGHQERYVADALGLLGRGTPLTLRSRRLNKFSGRAMDVSVVFDLMVHDLDLLAQFAPTADAEIVSMDAKFEHGDKADYIKVDLAFPGGLRAELSASRMEQNPIRDLLLGYPEGEVGLDFLGRMTRNTTPTALPFEMNAEEKPAAMADPLRFGTQSFVDAVQARSQPKITGADGRAALELALRIEEAANASKE